MRRLHRSRTNHIIGGVCGGLGDYFDLDPVLVRLIWLILILFGGVGLFLYLIAWVIIPVESESDQQEESESTVHTRGRLWWGLALVLTGVFLWGSQNYAIYWPIIPGVHLHTRDFVPLILVLVGAYLLLAFGRGRRADHEAGVQRLHRSRRDRKIGGVCGGFADYLQVDSTMVRVLWVAGSFFYGAGIILYLILLVALPDDPGYKAENKPAAKKKQPKPPAKIKKA